MYKLERLINELCPNGVEYVKLNTICKIYDGTHSTPQYTDEGVKFVSVQNINDLYATDKYISQDDFEKYKVTPQVGDVLMTRIGSIGVCAIVDRDEPLAYYVSLALLHPDAKVINSKYLKYAVESLHGRKELRKRTLVNAVPIKINKEDIGKITIPIPPLPVQKEIVKILDNFTELTSKLIAELTAELAAREKQYEYYRNRLLNFGDNVEWKTLGNIGRVAMCKRILKSQTTSTGDVPFYKIGTFGKKADAFISKELFLEYKEKYSYPKKGSILISAAGTIGRTVIYDGKPAYYQDSNIVWLEHDETVVLLSKLKTKKHIDIELHTDELDLTSSESKATYQEIKQYVLDKYGFKVSTLNIAQTKQKCGIKERDNYNKPKMENSKQPNCPKEKEDAIKDAFRYFQMI